jgi:hypothetical protein
MFGLRAGAGFLCAAAALAAALAPAQARIVRDGKPGGDEPAQAGGHHVVPGGLVHLQCAQFGAVILDVRNAGGTAAPVYGVMSSLSFLRPGERARTTVLPLGDGMTTCVISPER